MPLVLKLRSWWETSDRSQKTITLGGLALLFLLLIGTFVFATKPKFALLYSGMNEADKNTVVTEIQAMGIPVKYDVPGQVEIPQDKIGEVNMRLAGNGKLPKSAHPGIADLDKMNLFSTPAQERERLKVILEGELAKSIESLESVQAARVHITLGDNSPFVAERKPPTASITLTETPGATVAPAQGRAIAALVANACEGMALNQVTVLNQRMQFVFDGATLGDDKSIAADKLEMEKRVASERQRELQQALDTMFGPGSTVVRVSCTLDLDKERSQTNEKLPSEAPTSITKSREEFTGNNVKATGIAAVGSNTPNEGAPTTATGEGAGSYKNQSSQETREVTTVTKDVEKATGTLKSMVINVAANTDRIPDITGLQNFLDGEVKDRAADPINFPRPTVTGVKFDTSTADAIAKAQTEAAGQARMQQMMSLAPVIALLVVAFMVVRQIGKFAQDPASPPVSTDLAVVEVGGDAPRPLDGGDAFAPLPEFTDAYAMGDDTDNLLAALRATADSGGPDALSAPEIKDKVDVTLESLRRMADDRPQVFGQLIKSMLLEERK